MSDSDAFHTRQSVPAGPDLLAEIKSNLPARFVRRIRALQLTDSTNREASEWASAKTPTSSRAQSGAVVLADLQTAGRGRFSRRWSSESESNLLFSVVLDIGLEQVSGSRVPIAVAVALVRAIESLNLQLDVRCKWPNDIVLGATENTGRMSADYAKCGGVLIETVSSGSPNFPRYIVGIGLNYLQTEFPTELRSPATSIRLTTGSKVRIPNRFVVLGRILNQLDEVVTKVHNETDWAHIRSEYLSRMIGVGESVGFDLAGTPESVSGTLVGINDSGGLLIETKDGVTSFWAGEISSRPRNTNQDL